MLRTPLPAQGFWQESGADGGVAERGVQLQAPARLPGAAWVRPCCACLHVAVPTWPSPGVCIHEAGCVLTASL